MIKTILKSDFKKMPWKNGKGVSSQICIFPESATLDKNDFLYRLSSTPVESNGLFSQFPGKQRLLVPVKGAGFQLNEDIYEKFEVAHFSGDANTNCSLLKGPVLDFGVIYDPKLKIQSRILNLKTDFTFSLDPQTDHFFTVLDGALIFREQNLKDLETLHYQQENSCHLQVVKSAVLFYFSVNI